MNKTEFLDELKNGLAVLEEKEQQDILEEYTQHIDMKMEGASARRKPSGISVISASWRQRFWRHTT